MVPNTDATFQITRTQTPLTLRVSQKNSFFIYSQSQDTMALMTVLLNSFTTGSSIIPINMTNELHSQNNRSKSSFIWVDLLQCHHQ